MRKEEFMRQLEALLADISEEERREALSYYRSYFEDAGEENEERILRELESPQKVAATIKADLRMEQGNGTGAYAEQGTASGIYTERGFEDARFEERKQEVEVRGEAAGSQGRDWGETAGSQGRDWGETAGNQGFDRREHGTDADENRTLKIVLIAVVIVLTSPIWGSLLAAVLSLIAGIIGAVFGFIVAAIALYITGGVLFGVGISQFVVGSVAVGFALLGAAMLIWVVAILMTIFCVWACGKGIPWLCNAVGRLWKSIFPGKERAI